MTNTPNDEDFYETVFGLDGVKLTSGPTYSEPRDRPNSKHLTELPDKPRVANIVCRQKRRQVVAVVLGSSAKFMVSTTETALAREGEDFLASCHCPVHNHAIVGTELRRAVLAIRRGRGVPVIWVDTVERVLH